MNIGKVILAVLAIRAIYAAMFLLSKAAFDNGMNNFIYVFYRQASATIFLAPFAIYFEWKNAPPISLMMWCKIFVISLIGMTICSDILAIGLSKSSASLGAAAASLFMCLFLRIEVVNTRTARGIAKVVGIVASLAGAMIIALYEGPHFKLLLHNHLLGSHIQQQDHVQSGRSWILGCFLLVLSNALWALWLVVQPYMLEAYPPMLLSTTLQCFMSSIQSLVIAVAVERDIEQWKLGWDINLLTVLYCGIVVTGISFYLQAWVVREKDAVFLSMSSPLALIMTVVAAAILFGEIETLGTILGSLFLVIGLYLVLWGKREEQIPQ